MPSTPHPAAPLLNAFQNHILPPLERGVSSQILIAQPHWQTIRLPTAMDGQPRRRLGPRVAVKNQALFKRSMLMTARWPRDDLHELRVPKLVFIFQGRAVFHAGDYELRCRGGNGIFIPSGVPHTSGALSHVDTNVPGVHECHFLWVTPQVSGIACRMCHSHGIQHYGPAGGEKVYLHNPRLLQYMGAMNEEATELSQGNPALNLGVFESLMLCFLRTLVRDLMEQRFLMHDVPAFEESGASRDADPIAAATRYVQTHFASPLAIDDVARRFFLSRSQFTRQFRQRHGRSFLEFLNDCRIEQARTLLKETEWTAAMIGRSVGFKSAAHFHRLFVRETGVSPTLYRGQSRETSSGSK